MRAINLIFLKTTGQLFLLCIAFITYSHADVNDGQNRLNNIEENLAEIEHFLTLKTMQLPTKDVLALSSHIIEKRNFYNENTIAKAYVLLSDIALNRGDLAKAFQFATDGLGLNISEPLIKLNLQLKTVEGYYAKGKFQDVKKVADEMILFTKDESFISYRLKALGYRAVFYAFIVDYPSALTDLKQIEEILDIHQQFSDHIDLLEILATAHHYLSDYETAISIHLKLLNLRYQVAQIDDIGDSYFALASAYRQLNKLDDAYDTFWQAQQHAKKIQSPIQQAYAELGLGEVLLLQNAHRESLTHLNQAQQLFRGHNLSKPYLSTLIFLAKVHLALNNTEQAYHFLSKAEYLAKSISLSTEQIDLYQLLSNMYSQLNQQEKAWVMLNKYISLYRNTESQRKTFLETQKKADRASQQNRKATLELALRSELQAQYITKSKKESQVTNQLWGIIVILSITILILLWLYRKQTHEKNDTEQQINTIANSEQTKQMYQSAYKMARKYQYTLSVAYLVIHNWQDLTFKSNRKELAEVSNTIATVINEYKNEFDLAGLLNEGQYLLIFPHQREEDVEKLVAALSEALKVRFFANLGEVVVNINYTLDTLNVQDIDPFIFLSRLIDSVKK